ncbi:MAG: NAD-binding protein, partial [Kiritimatiellia bacterium]|nr:NAD-binding protein [Kiritimatiellia bacterium]
MSSVTEQQLRRRALTLFAILFGVLLYGAVGYRLLSGGKASWVDCLYMTTITVTTIGFGEVLPGSDGSGFRLFTLTLAFLGVGIFTYTVSSITFFATDEGLRARWRKRRMEKSLQNWNGHYLIGGWSAIAERIAGELRKTGRRVLTIAPARGACAGEPEELVLEGDPSDDEALRRAGIERAAGFFAASGDDSANIVSCLTARQLQPGIRIVAALVDPRNEGKMRRAGADAVISAPTIGALRMASEMVRPTVV